MLFVLYSWGEITKKWLAKNKTSFSYKFLRLEVFCQQQQLVFYLGKKTLFLPLNHACILSQHSQQQCYLYAVAGFEPGSSVPQADAMTTAPRSRSFYLKIISISLGTFDMGAHTSYPANEIQ
jgi:hypothetical protein